MSPFQEVDGLIVEDPTQVKALEPAQFKLAIEQLVHHQRPVTQGESLLLVAETAMEHFREQAQRISFFYRWLAFQQLMSNPMWKGLIPNQSYYERWPEPCYLVGATMALDVDGHFDVEQCFEYYQRYVRDGCV